MPVDLHIHSTASDGRLSPEQIVRLSHSLGLKAISITDHDTVNAVPTAVKEASGTTLEVVPAVEMSSDAGELDIHILGYYIDYSANWFRNILEELRLKREARAKSMIGKLIKAGVSITLDEVVKEARDGSLGRAHMARVMIKNGIVSSMQEAFDIYLGKNCGYYVKKSNYSPSRVINYIKKAGGIPVLAHPGLNNSERMIDELIKQGLKGIEAYHSQHTRKQKREYRKLAIEKGLLVTGGSDCHGFQCQSGYLLGTVAVPDSCYTALAKENRK